MCHDNVGGPSHGRVLIRLLQKYCSLSRPSRRRRRGGFATAWLCTPWYKPHRKLSSPPRANAHHPTTHAPSSSPPSLLKFQIWKFPIPFPLRPSRPPSASSRILWFKSFSPSPPFIHPKRRILPPIRPHPGNVNPHTPRLRRQLLHHRIPLPLRLPGKTAGSSSCGSAPAYWPAKTTHESSYTPNPFLPPPTPPTPYPLLWGGSYESAWAEPGRGGRRPGRSREGWEGRRRGGNPKANHTSYAPPPPTHSPL